MDESSIKLSQNLEKIEFHYLFDDDSIHSIDAYTRNSCEKEFLNFITKISSEFGLVAKVKAEPAKEGSHIDVYSIFATLNSLSIPDYVTLVISIFTLLFSIKTKDERKGQKLENLLKEAEVIQKLEELKQKGLPIPQNIENYVNKLCNSRKLDKQKSNFFKNLSKEKRIKAIEISSKPRELEEKVFSTTIQRTEFEDYYLETDKLDSIIDNNAEIEIISPVLKNGNYSWRGIYIKENLSHEYSMQDKEFKNKVIDEALTFQNGTRLQCELEICRKLNEEGNTINSGYKIKKVFNQYIGDTVIEMPSGKKRREKKEIEDSQPSLFDGMI